MTQNSPPDLASVLRRHLDAWGLSEPHQLADTATSQVFRVRQRDGTFAVLKCLTAAGRHHEGSAPCVLKAFGGRGAVRLLTASPEAHLIEFCDGPDLLGLERGASDDVAAPIFVEVIRGLHAARGQRPDGVETLAERCEALDRGLGHRPDLDHFKRARGIADTLLASQKPQLLHGDLHHSNVLRAHREDGPCWLAIDPQGIWGDAAYDVANLFGNPLGFPEVTLDEDRPQRLAETLGLAFGFDPSRVLRFAYVHSCISAAWAIEDGESPVYRLRVADLLRRHL